jgi:RHS repeat-associated protein
VVARYLYGDRIDEALARYRPGEGTAWYLADRLGTVHDIANSTGVVVDHIVYDAFGNLILESAPAYGDRIKFTGREYDPETGLYYDRARYYDPRLGRFISEDPLRLGGGDVNLYRYVVNEPTNATDPNGHQALAEYGTLLRVAGVGAAAGFTCGIVEWVIEGKDPVRGIVETAYYTLGGAFIAPLALAFVSYAGAVGYALAGASGTVLGTSVGTVAVGLGGTYLSANYLNDSTSVKQLFARIGCIGASFAVGALAAKAITPKTASSSELHQKVLGQSDALDAADAAREIQQANRYAQRNDVTDVYLGQEARDQFNSPKNEKFPDVVAKKRDGSFALGEGKGTDIASAVRQFETAGKTIAAAVENGRVSEQEIVVKTIPTIQGERSPGPGYRVNKFNYLEFFDNVEQKWVEVKPNEVPVKVVDASSGGISSLIPSAITAATSTAAVTSSRDDSR